jgi:hypothetical protein
MKPLKRKFLSNDELLKFNDANNFEIERHINIKNFNHLENDTIKLWLDHSYSTIADVIIITAIYFDTSKKIEKGETIEFIEIHDLILPQKGITKQNEFLINIKSKEDTKVLWKINFKITPEIVSDLHISIN